MKKRTGIFFAVLMVGCSIFSGCAEETSSEKSVSPQQETESPCKSGYSDRGM